MKRDRPDKPGRIGSVKRSIYSRQRDPKPVKMVVSEGRVVGWLLRDGSFVRQGEPCCKTRWNVNAALAPGHRRPVPGGCGRTNS